MFTCKVHKETLVIKLNKVLRIDVIRILVVEKAVKIYLFIDFYSFYCISLFSRAYSRRVPISSFRLRSVLEAISSILSTVSSFMRIENVL